MFTPVKLQTSCPGLARRPVLLVPVFLALRWIGGLGVPSYEIDVNAVPDALQHVHERLANVLFRLVLDAHC
jgi:hypothetical protein